MKHLVRALVALALLLPAWAHAAYSCTVSSPGFSTAYSSGTPTTTSIQTYLTITCTRALSDAATMSYTVTNNNGLNSNGIHNRASFSTGLMNYDLFQDSGCSIAWRNTKSTGITGTLNFSGSTTASINVSYWGCIPSGQTGLAAGTYTDTVTMTLTYGPGSGTATTGTFGVNIATPATCNVTTPPTDIIFNYTSFGSAATASTSFGVTCTSYLPYTMALDATSGTILGINYTLALSASSATGSGVQQLYSINGTIAAGQAGTCATGSCTGSQARTLTVTY